MVHWGRCLNGAGPLTRMGIVRGNMHGDSLSVISNVNLEFVLPEVAI